MWLGYARVSKSDEQRIEVQTEALKKAGAERIFEESASGGRWDRQQLHRLLDHLRPGDIVVVHKLDRLSRSLKDLLLLMDKIEEAGAGFRSLTEAIDTTTPAGRMMMQMLGIFAEFEREMIRERTRAGLASAREQGRVGGRPNKLSKEQKKTAVELIKAGKSTAEVSRIFKVNPSTMWRMLKKIEFKEEQVRTAKKHQKIYMERMNDKASESCQEQVQEEDPRQSNMF